MRLYELTFNEELEVMKKYSLSYELLCIVKLLFLLQENEDNYELCHTYFNQCRKYGLKKEELLMLQDCKVITKDSYIPEKGEEIILDEIEFRDGFVKNFYKSSHQLGKELWEEFPFYIVTNKMNYPIKNFSKRFRDLPELFNFYGKSISYNQEYHNKVIASLKYAKEYDLISCNIVDYLIGNQWEQHIRMMDGIDPTTSITFNTTQLL